VLAVCLMVAFIAFAYPMYVIRPFRTEGATELAIAGGVVAVLVGLRKRVLPVIAAVLTVAFAVLSNINVFEITFHRIDPEIMRASADAVIDDVVLRQRSASGVDLLNALSHRSGVETIHRRTRAHVPARGHQQPELPHTR
jgi:hypothetical protein